MSGAAELMRALGLPGADAYDHPASTQRFGDGGHWRIEIPSVEDPASLEAVVGAAEELEVPLHRVSQGGGIGLLGDAEIAAMAAIGAERAIEVALFVGPRAPWDGTAQALTPQGGLIGWRHTGMDQLRYALEDVYRAAELGIRGILVADEGLTWLIQQARQRGELPPDLIVKGSAFLGVANPVGIRLLAEAGVDTINVTSDTSLARLAAIRAVVAIPIDLYIESPDSLGGFVRTRELPEIVRLAAPIHLKFGLRNAASLYPTGEHLAGLAISSSRERVRRAAIGLELLRSGAPDLQPSALAPDRPGVPKPA